jgi:predicted patatin/cPLA2 family phospholipase
MNYEDMKSVFDCAKKHYSPKKLEHATKVTEYIELDCRYDLMTTAEQNFVRAVAIAHDVIEDTKCSWSELQSGILDEEERRKFYIAIDLLTHRHEDSYEAYIDKIIRSNNLFAIMVKQADMKDHIRRTTTLTKKLKEKYLPVMPRLLRA